MTDDPPIHAIETHISILFFTPDRVYKLLKPIDVGFLDHTDVAARLDAVDDELRLNRRFAPDVYLGTADVIERDEVVDRLLVMRRLPADRRLTSVLTAGPTDATEHLLDVARVVASVHADAPPVDEPRPLASADGLAGFWRASFDAMAPLLDGVIDRDEFDEVRSLALGYLEHRAGLFDRRRRDGYVRDGHGDLVADDIYVLDDGPRILDCLAFDADYRICDVLGDIAFLVMDVERIAGPHAAATLLGHYQELTAERHPPTLIEHWIAYRAHVRAKVALLRHDQGAAEEADTARTYHRLALQHLRRGRMRIVLIGGGPGTGKSTLARALAARTGWAIVDSDTVRKDEHRIDHADHAVSEHPDLYGPAATRATYDELVRRAIALVENGVPAILDATWQRQDDRDRVREAADRLGAALVEIECDVASDVARDRIRDRSPDDPSDATPDLVERWREGYEPWVGARRVDSSRDLDELTDDVLVACGFPVG